MSRARYLIWFCFGVAVYSSLSAGQADDDRKAAKLTLMYMQSEERLNECVKDDNVARRASCKAVILELQAEIRRQFRELKQP
jgi:hypothetical protein